MKAFLGLDVGTQGVRAVICCVDGSIICSFDKKFKQLNLASEKNYMEQSAVDWWDCAVEVLKNCMSELGKTEYRICAISIDGTSGTILPIDIKNKPLRNAIMYNDGRATEEATYLHSISATHEKAHGYIFNASYALPKILWIKNNEPDIYAKTQKFIHQTDYIVGRLSGVFAVSDYSNALKTGYDLIHNRWPGFIEKAGINLKLLPEIKEPGDIIAKTGKEIETITGIPEGTNICAGVSDGYASSLAAGLASVGQWVTVIGTTMVLKGISSKLIIDESGRVYSHKHPQGWWMPGGASNIGGKILNEMFGTDRLDLLNKNAEKYTPTGILSYPLSSAGERFPFVNRNAEFFMYGNIIDEYAKYAAVLEGIGYAEKLSYDLLGELGYEIGQTIFSSGGACKSNEWLQIRSNILNKEIKVPMVTDAAIGSAIIAAKSEYGSLEKAVIGMVKFKKSIKPELVKAQKYNEYYKEFKNICKLKGWIQ